MEITIQEGLTSRDGISRFRITVEYEGDTSRFRQSFEVDSGSGYEWFFFTQKEGKWVLDSNGKGFKDEDAIAIIKRAQVLYTLVPPEQKDEFRNKVVHRLRQFMIELGIKRAREHLLMSLKLFKPFDV
jgi:hypothetical protein